MGFRCVRSSNALWGQYPSFGALANYRSNKVESFLQGHYNDRLSGDLRVTDRRWESFSATWDAGGKGWPQGHGRTSHTEVTRNASGKGSQTPWRREDGSTVSLFCHTTEVQGFH